MAPPDASFPTDVPEAGDLSLLTAAPPKPDVDTICDLASVTPAPPGHHPGHCAVVGVLGEKTVSTHDSYVDGRVATERREEWWTLTSNDGMRRVYERTDLDNGYDRAARLSRVIKKTWSRVEPNWQSDSTAWEQTDYIYGIHQFSTRRMVARNYQGSSSTAPEVVELDDFVVDALGKVIPTRQSWVEGRGGGYSRQVGLHPNGVEAWETWSGGSWFSETGSSRFDDSGHPLVEDSSSFRSGNGTNRWHVEYSYDAGRLTQRRGESGYYSDWTGEPLLGGTKFVDTSTYDSVDAGAGREPRLARIDTTVKDGSCTLNDPGGGNNWFSTCVWTDGAPQHTQFRYDDSGNLIERTVTDAAGKELSRWIAVADRDGNLLCERQSTSGALTFYRRYDYSCW